MTYTRLRAGTIACALLASTAPLALAMPAQAQTQTTAGPVRQFPDGNGVDLMTGKFTVTTGISIGDADSGLSFTREIQGGLALDNMLGAITGDGSTYTVTVGGQTELFNLSGGVFTPLEQNGSTLTLSGTSYTYRSNDGTAALFTTSSGYSFGNATGIHPSSVTYPNGKSLTFHYAVDSFTFSPYPGQTATVSGRRLQSVTSNTGYHLKFSYESDTVNNTSNAIAAWSNLTKVMGLNDLVDSCATSATSCTASGSRPTLSMSPLIGSGNVREYTDSLSRTTTYTFGTDGISSIKLPGSSTDNVSVSYTSGRVSSVTAFGITTNYSYADAAGIRTTTVRRGGGSNPDRILKFDLTKLQLVSVQDELGKITAYEYDSSNRPTKVTAPEGNYVTYGYDARGNVTSTTITPKSGSGQSPITTSASYDASCTVTVKCNKPNSATDARGNTTDYTYDSTHGGVLTVTAPPHFGRGAAASAIHLCAGEFVGRRGVERCLQAQDRLRLPDAGELRRRRRRGEVDRHLRPESIDLHCVDRRRQRLADRDRSLQL